MNFRSWLTGTVSLSLLARREEKGEKQACFVEDILCNRSTSKGQLLKVVLLKKRKCFID